MFYANYRNRFMVTVAHQAIRADMTSAARFAVLATSDARVAVYDAVQRAMLIERVRSFEIPQSGPVSHLLIKPTVH